MKRILFSTLFLLITISSFSQNKLRDSIYVETEIFTLVYSEKLEQPKWIKYDVECPKGGASRKGMDFYTNDSIKTSDNQDYINNIWDKGHMAPAADFNCTKEMLKMTFSYLNCVLQNQDLNRTTWRLLEEYERLLALNYEVSVEIRCVFSKKSTVLTSGATIPDGFYKIISYNGKKETYYFKNEKPSTTDFKKFLITQ
jgi:endonuclease G